MLLARRGMGMTQLSDLFGSTGMEVHASSRGDDHCDGMRGATRDCRTPLDRLQWGSQPSACRNRVLVKGSASKHGLLRHHARLAGLVRDVMSSCEPRGEGLGFAYPPLQRYAAQPAGRLVFESVMRR